MGNGLVGRREVLTGAGAAGAAVLLGGVGNATIAKADDGGRSSGLGTFWFKVTTTSAGGPPPFNAVVGFAGGGVALTNDGSHPNNTYLGAWNRDGNSLEVQFRQFAFDKSGNNFGYVRIDVKGELDGDSSSGTFTVTLVPNSGPTQPIGNGTFSGTRIEV